MLLLENYLENYIENTKIPQAIYLIITPPLYLSFPIILAIIIGIILRFIITIIIIGIIAGNERQIS